MEFSACKILSDGVIDLSVEYHYYGKGRFGVLPFYGCSVLLTDSKIKIGNLTLRICPADPTPEQTEQLYYEGHIGYGIFEPFRGNGYAGRACRLAAQIARKHGLTEILINCNVANTASVRVIEKLGAVKTNEFDTPATHLDENDPTPRRSQYRWRLDEEA